jgi:hypothetical protein
MQYHWLIIAKQKTRSYCITHTHTHTHARTQHKLKTKQDLVKP